VATEKLPGGYTLKQAKDAAGAVVERTYTRDSDGVTVYNDAATFTIHGQAATRSGWSHQEFGYDDAGRLTRVEDTSDNICTLRTYALDSRSNRTGTTEVAAAPGLLCPTSVGAAKSHT
jgi:YD repeat-containing protein